MADKSAAYTTGENPMKPKHFLIASLFAASMMLSTGSRALAQPYACSASANVTPVWCEGGDPAGCAPAAMTNGMATKLFVNIANDGQYNGPLTDPPSAVSIGFTMRVVYSCTDSTCATVNSGWFTYTNSTCAAGCTFANDASGDFGTITCPASVFTFSAGDTAAQNVCTIELTANAPPGSSIFSTRAGVPAEDTSDQILQLQENTNCIANVTGGGQGSTAAAFASTPPSDLDFCTHPNKQSIKLKSGNDIGKGRVAVPIPAGCDLENTSLTIGYDNDVGGAFTFNTLSPGDLEQTGRCFNYSDSSAKLSGGMKKVRICPMSFKPGYACINFKGYGDIAPILLDPLMPITVDLCGESWEGPQPPTHNDAIWRTGTRNWKLPRTVWNKP